MEGAPENQFWPYFNEDNTEEEVIDDFLNVLLEVESIDAAERTQHSTKIEGGDAVPVGERAGIANLEGLEIPHVGSLADAADGGDEPSTLPRARRSNLRRGRKRRSGDGTTRHGRR